MLCISCSLVDNMEWLTTYGLAGMLHVILCNGCLRLALLMKNHAIYQGDGENAAR